MALSSKQSETLGEKLLDLANISVAALTFGALISERGFQIWLFISGMILWGAFATAGIALLGKE